MVLTSLAVAAAGQEILVSRPGAVAGRDRRARFLTCCAQSPSICGPHCAGAKCESRRWARVSDGLHCIAGSSKCTVTCGFTGAVCPSLTCQQANPTGCTGGTNSACDDGFTQVLPHPTLRVSRLKTIVSGWDEVLEVCLDPS